MELMTKFPNKLFVFVAHEKKGLPDPSVAEIVRRLSDIKIRVDGYKAFTITRFDTNGKGGEDYCVRRS